MWMFCYIVKREANEDDNAAKVRALAMFPLAKFVVVGPANVRPFVKAELDTETAALLAANPKLLGGSAKLCWVPEGAADDIGRAIQENQQLGMEGRCECMICQGGAKGGDKSSAEPSLQDLLGRLRKSASGRRPPPEFLEFLLTMGQAG